MTIQEIKDQCDMRAAWGPKYSDPGPEKAFRALKIAISALQETAKAFPDDSATAWVMRDSLTAIEKAFTP